MRHKLLPVILAGLLPGAVAAFDANGFTAGMSEEAAIKRLRERKDTVQEVRGGTEVSRTYIGSLGGDSNVEAITLCRGRLQSYQYDIAGGLRAFVRLVQAEQASAGRGVAEATSRETPGGEWSQIKFTWSAATGVKEIAYSRVGGEQVYVRHASSHNTCP